MRCIHWMNWLKKYDELVSLNYEVGREGSCGLGKSATALSDLGTRSPGVSAVFFGGVTQNMTNMLSNHAQRTL
uniref:Uncharacterized protein n=1 Tax=Ascaris lumbricoides TaxID=6252 RepID=A0A0M3I0S1_ASCLU